MENRHMGEIVTFYSYKGGVGRTMAMANISVLLSQWGYKVLMVDWDLEAPGLEYFFKEFIPLEKVVHHRGILDIIEQFMLTDNKNDYHPKWEDAIIKIKVPGSREQLHLITAGSKTNDYSNRVRQLDFKYFYKIQGGFIIERLREEWKMSYDYILVDSRTGLTDIGGICTVQLPDIVVMLFTATYQNLYEIPKISKRITEAVYQLPFDRKSLLCLPIPTRFDSNEEFKISQDWLTRFSNNLSDIYDNWVPRMINNRDLLEKSKLPYIPYFSFGEKLAVLEQGTNDTSGLGYAYATISAMIANKLDFIDKLLKNRDEYTQMALKDLKEAYKPVEIETIYKAFIPAFQYDIYISYAHVDNMNLANEKGWIDEFQDYLEVTLSKIVGRQKAVKIFRDVDLVGNVPYNSKVIEKLNQSALFIAITSPGYLHSEYCKKELNQFYQKASSESIGLAVGDQYRIFNIQLANIKPDDLPDEFNHTPTYNFYDENGIYDPAHKKFRSIFQEFIQNLYYTLISLSKSTKK